MRRYALVFALLAAGARLVAVPVYAEDGPGAVSGQVVNGTPGGAPAAGLEVTLGVYRANDLEREVQGQADETGHFRFAGLDVDRELTYQVGTVYADMLYRSDPIKLTDKQPEQQVTLDVYEPTPTDPGLRASQVLVSLGIARDAPSDLVVTELVKLVNTSDRTFVPQPGGPAGPMGLVRFGLPPGARSFEPGLGLDARQVVQVDRGFASLAPVPPGDSMFRFSYRVPLHAAEAALEKSLPYGADLLRVVAEEGGPRVRGGPTLTFEQAVDSKGSKLLVWAAHDLAPGTRLNIELSDLPGPPAWTTRIGAAIAWPWMIGAAVALLPLLGVFWTVRGRRDARPRTDTPGPVSQTGADFLVALPGWTRR
jgi:hypothetical protein